MIEYKIYGSLRSKMGDAVIRVTADISPEAEHFASCFNLGRTLGYASLVFVPNAKRNIYNIIHFQPSHVKFESRAREYCTRCIYELSATDFARIDYAFRRLFMSIPRMSQYDDVKYSVPPIPLSGMVQETPVLSDCEIELLNHILVARERKARLFIKIGNRKYLDEGIYFENGVLDSQKLHSFLNVLDFLPVDYRKDISFAFSVDHVVGEYIKNTEVVFFQDELHDWGIDANDIVFIDWSGDDIVSNVDDKVIVSVKEKNKEELFARATGFEDFADLLKNWGRPRGVDVVLDKIVTSLPIDYLSALKVLPSQVLEYKPDIDNLINTRRSVIDRLILLKSPCFSIRVDEIKIDGWILFTEVHECLFNYYKQDWKRLLSEILKNNKPWEWSYAHCLDDLSIDVVGAFSENAKSEIRKKYIKENLRSDKCACFFANGYTKEEWINLLNDKALANIAIEKLLKQTTLVIDLFDGNYDATLKNYIDYEYGRGVGVNSEIVIGVVAKCTDEVANYIFDKYCRTNSLSECLKTFEKRLTDRLKRKSVEVCSMSIEEEYSLENVSDMVLLMQKYNLDNLLADKFFDIKFTKINERDCVSHYKKIENTRIREIIEAENERIRISELPVKSDIIGFYKKQSQKLSAIGDAEDILWILNEKQNNNAIGIKEVLEFNKVVGLKKTCKAKSSFSPLSSFWMNLFDEVVEFLKKYGADRCPDSYKWVNLSNIRGEQSYDVEKLFELALCGTNKFSDNDWREILDGIRKFVHDKSNSDSRIKDNEPLHRKKGDDFYKLSVRLKKLMSLYNKSLSRDNSNPKPIVFSNYIIVERRKLTVKGKIIVSFASVAAVLLAFIVSSAIIVIKTPSVHSMYYRIVGYGCNRGLDSVHNNPIVSIANWVADTTYKDTTGTITNLYVKYRCIDSVYAQEPVWPFLRRFVKQVPPTLYENDSLLIHSLSYHSLDSIRVFDSIWRSYSQLTYDSDTLFLVCKWKERRQWKVDTLQIYNGETLLNHFLTDSCIMFKSDSVFCDDSRLLLEDWSVRRDGMQYLRIVRQIDTLINKKIAY